MSKAKRSLAPQLGARHRMRHAQSMATIQARPAGATEPSAGSAGEHAELALHNLNAVQRLQKKNEALEEQLTAALDACAQAEERARHAEAESAHQRERTQDIAAEADEEIASLRQQLLELEAQQQQQQQQGEREVDGGGRAHQARRKQRRASYVQRLDEDGGGLGGAGGGAGEGGGGGGGDGRKAVCGISGGGGMAPHVDAEQLLLAMRYLVELSKDIVVATKPGEYADELL